MEVGYLRSYGFREEWGCDFIAGWSGSCCEEVKCNYFLAIGSASKDGETEREIEGEGGGEYGLSEKTQFRGKAFLVVTFTILRSRKR